MSGQRICKRSCGLMMRRVDACGEAGNDTYSSRMLGFNFMSLYNVPMMTLEVPAVAVSSSKEHERVMLADPFECPELGGCWKGGCGGGGAHPNEKLSKNLKKAVPVAPDGRVRPLCSSSSRYCRLELVEAAVVYVRVSAACEMELKDMVVVVGRRGRCYWSESAVL